MTALLIKDLPPELHRRLKQEASRYHRSMTRQALVLLEHALTAPTKNAATLLLEPVKPATPLKSASVVSLIRRGRERKNSPALGKTRATK